MRTEVRGAGKARVVEVYGKVIFGSDTPLVDVVKGLLDQGVRKIVVNLEKIDRIDSSGIGTLIHCRKMAEACEGSVVLVRPAKEIALRPLWMTLMLEYFETYEEELTAVGSI